jgi:hypothetical protein
VNKKLQVYLSILFKFCVFYFEYSIFVVREDSFDDDVEFEHVCYSLPHSLLRLPLLDDLLGLEATEERLLTVQKHTHHLVRELERVILHIELHAKCQRLILLQSRALWVIISIGISFFVLDSNERQH